AQPRRTPDPRGHRTPARGRRPGPGAALPGARGFVRARPTHRDPVPAGRAGAPRGARRRRGGAGRDRGPDRPGHRLRRDAGGDGGRDPPVDV
ncbi:MAG: hypothetical protein AVDCRST_MAG66-4716, partial [uncultured Pseudonocardia sp.]